MTVVRGASDDTCQGGGAHPHMREVRWECGIEAHWGFGEGWRGMRQVGVSAPCTMS